MNHQQSEEENRKEFIQLLIDAGWTKTEAEEEWESIQNDTEAE